MSEYLVEPPFAWITAMSLFEYISTNFAHQDWNICPFFLAELLKFSQIAWWPLKDCTLQVIPQILNGI